MSIMRSSGVRSTLTSFIEVTFFFCVLSVAFFVICFGAYHVIAQPRAKMIEADELSQALDKTLRSATAMVDARRDALEKDALAAEAFAAVDQARIVADADPANQEAAERLALAQQEATTRENDAKRAVRLADDATREAQDDIAGASRLMLADSSETAGRLSTIAGEVVGWADDMMATIDSASRATTPPPAEPEGQGDKPEDDNADKDDADQQRDQAPELARGVLEQLGQLFIDLAAKVETLDSLTESYIELTKNEGDEDSGIQGRIDELTTGAEAAAIQAVQTAAGAILTEQVESIAEAAKAAVVEIVGPDRTTDEDAEAIQQAVSDAITTSRDTVGRIDPADIPDIVELVDQAARIALDDVKKIRDEDIAAIDQVVERLLLDALASANAKAAPQGEPGQTPKWAEELVATFTADRLQAEKILADSVSDISQAIRAVESAAADVHAATPAARSDITDAPWSREANQFIDRVGQVEQLANQLLAESAALNDWLAADQAISEPEQLAAIFQMEQLAAGMIADTKAVADNPPANDWAGQEQLKGLIEQIEESLGRIVAEAKDLADRYKQEPEVDQEPAGEPGAYISAEAYADAPAAGPMSPRQRLPLLAAQFHLAAKLAVSNCQSAREAIHKQRTEQAKELVDMVWRIDDRAKQIARRSRTALEVTNAASRGQVTPGEGKWDSFKEGLAEVRMGRVFQSEFPLINFKELFGSLPWWMWVIEGLVYLLILTVYWAPSEDAAMNQCELRAFVIFACVAAVCGLAALQLQGQYLSKPVKLFFEILGQRN